MDIMAFIDALEDHMTGGYRPEIANMSNSGKKWWFSRIRKEINGKNSELSMQINKLSKALESAEKMHVELHKCFEKQIIPELKSMRVAIHGEIKEISSSSIIDAVCEYCGVRRHQLESRKRTRGFVRARCVAAFLLYHLLHLGMTEIGRILGGRDHSTIIHAIEKVRKSEELRKISLRVASRFGAEDIIMRALSEYDGGDE